MEYEKKQVVALNGIEVFAYHGYYPEEQVLGTSFIVDVWIEFQTSGNTSDDLSETIDYVKVNHIVLTEMKHTSKLIETVAERIINKLIQLNDKIDLVRLSIKKLHPPMTAVVNNSNIILEYQRKYNEV